MVMDYNWYDVVYGDNLQQGDFIFNLDVLVVKETKEDKTLGEIETYDVIVITQSCDILKRATEHIIMCPVWTLEYAIERNPQFDDEEYLEMVRMGRVFKYHILDKCEIEGYKSNYRIVQFERTIVRPKSAILEALRSAGNHLRLLPPYREELAQRFGFFFARVAKQIEIPCFVK